MLLYTAIWHCFVYYSKRAQLFSRWRDGLLERSTARAKATRSGNSLRLEVQWTSNASFVASAYSTSVLARFECHATLRKTKLSSCYELRSSGRRQRKYGIIVSTVSSAAARIIPTSTYTALKNKIIIEPNAISAAHPHKISTAPCTECPMRNMR